MAAIWRFRERYHMRHDVISIFYGGSWFYLSLTSSCHGLQATALAVLGLAEDVTIEEAQSLVVKTLWRRRVRREGSCEKRS